MADSPTGEQYPWVSPGPRSAKDRIIETSLLQAAQQAQQQPAAQPQPVQTGGGGGFTLGLPHLDAMSNWVGSGLSTGAEYVGEQFSPSTIMSNLGEAFGGGGDSKPASTSTTETPIADAVRAAGLGTAAQDATAGTVNPLAMQLYFTQNIAPLLQGVMDKADKQSHDFLDLAQKGTANLHLPDSYRGIFESMLPRQQAAHSDVMASLAGAVAAAPALDSLQKQIANATNQATKDYYAQEALRALGGAGAAIPSAADIAAATGG